jgi:hypothetical protein
MKYDGQCLVMPLVHSMSCNASGQIVFTGIRMECIISLLLRAWVFVLHMEPQYHEHTNGHTHTHIHTHNARAHTQRLDLFLCAQARILNHACMHDDYVSG